MVDRTEYIRWETRASKKAPGMYGEHNEPSHAADYESYAIETSVEEGQEVLLEIQDAITERDKEGFSIDQLVLGVEKYKDVVAYSKVKSGIEPEAQFPDIELIVVPGDQITPVLPKRHQLTEHMRETQEEREEAKERERMESLRNTEKRDYRDESWEFREQVIETLDCPPELVHIAEEGYKVTVITRRTALAHGGFQSTNEVREELLSHVPGTTELEVRLLDN